MAKYNKDWLIHNFEKGKRKKFLFFWGHQKSRSGELTSSCFSQWYESLFVVDNIKYGTAEHWMMAQKALLFGDVQIYEKIIVANSPAEAKKLGRQVRNFEESIWAKKRSEIVVKGNLEKFTQHKDLKSFLLNTGDRVLVEASPVDTIWGIGLRSEDQRSKNPLRWKGLNLLDFALMEVRDIIRSQDY